jgi:aarF domain-containing kinase
VFEAALTGRAVLEGATDDPTDGKPWSKKASMLEMVPQSEEEMEAIRTAVVNREGLLVSVLDVLRRVPRRVLMVFKLNDLTRYGSPSLSFISMTHSLALEVLTTHLQLPIPT